MTALKSVWAVLAGILINVILSTGTDTILEKASIFPPQNAGSFTTGMLAIALGYRLVYTFLGGYATAKLAPDRPLRHVIILGVIGTILCIIGTIVGWDLSEHWYPIVLAITAFPVTWMGGVRGAIRGK